MRIVALSDTHGYHHQLDIPDGDILLHSGDLTNRGTLREVEEFSTFLSQLPHRHKVVIAGNHDFCFEREPEEAAEALTDCIYLRDESVEIEGLKIYGSPWQPEFFDWAFNLPRGEPLAEKWRQIPDDTDILLTHGPPMGCLDKTDRGVLAGCEALAERLQELNVRLHIFGHIHEAYGHLQLGKTQHYNASILQHLERRLEKPWVIDL